MNNKITWGHILFILNRHALYKFNDSTTWSNLEKMLPGIVINDELNTPETIDRHVLRFQYNNGVFEFTGQDVIAVN